jgi:hypothetical protein
MRLTQEDLELKAHIDRFLGLSPCGVNDAGNSVDEWLRPDSPRPLVGQSPEEVVATVRLHTAGASLLPARLELRVPL